MLCILAWTQVEGNIFDEDDYEKSPLALERSLKNTAWGIVLILKCAFAIIPFLSRSHELKDILHDKIRYSYCII